MRPCGTGLSLNRTPDNDNETARASVLKSRARGAASKRESPAAGNTGRSLARETRMASAGAPRATDEPRGALKIGLNPRYLSVGGHGPGRSRTSAPRIMRRGKHLQVGSIRGISSAEIHLDRVLCAELGTRRELDAAGAGLVRPHAVLLVQVRSRAWAA